MYYLLKRLEISSVYVVPPYEYYNVFHFFIFYSKDFITHICIAKKPYLRSLNFIGFSITFHEVLGQTIKVVVSSCGIYSYRISI